MNRRKRLKSTGWMLALILQSLAAASAFAVCTPAADPDLNNDGAVTLADIIFVVRHFGLPAGLTLTPVIEADSLHLRESAATDYAQTVTAVAPGGYQVMTTATIAQNRGDPCHGQPGKPARRGVHGA